MRTFDRSIGLVCGVLLLSGMAAGADALAAPTTPVTPAVAGYGAVLPLPQAAYQPQPGDTYKVVFPVSLAGKKPSEPSPALERVARAVNLYVSAGVPLDHLKFVAVIHGPATGAALDDAHYRTKFGTANPNLPLIDKLRSAGVEVVVCGQAVAGMGYKNEWLAPSVTLALSAITTITVLEHQGYLLMPE